MLLDCIVRCVNPDFWLRRVQPYEVRQDFRNLFKSLLFLRNVYIEPPQLEITMKLFRGSIEYRQCPLVPILSEVLGSQALCSLTAQTFNIELELSIPNEVGWFCAWRVDLMLIVGSFPYNFRNFNLEFTMSRATTRDLLRWTNL